jgi:hypothetical protein
LPAAELERRWNEILQAVAKIEADIAAKVPIWSLTASEAGLIAGASQGEIGHQCDCWNEETVSLAVKLLNTIGPDCIALLVGNLEGLETDGPKGRKLAFHVGWPTGQRATVP